ncbi:MAG: hypothetical protein ACFKPT_20370 [Gloeotrichia echinulata GP01]
MANAILVNSLLAGILFPVNTASFISTAMQAAGWTLVDTYNSGQSMTFSWTLNASTKGTVFANIVVTTNAINFNLLETWNTTTRTGTLSTTNSGGGFSLSNSTTTIYCTAINHPELRGIVLSQYGNSTRFLGALRPQGLAPSWWNESSFCWAFAPSNAFPPTFFSTSAPWANASNLNCINSSQLQDGNTYNGNARSILPLILMNNGNTGVLATCNDVVICASAGLLVGDTLTVSGSEVYTYIYSSTGTNGIAIRTT